MRTVRSTTPPLWKVRDGETFIVSFALLNDETVEVWSPVGDGAWFFTDGWNKVVVPKLKAGPMAPVDVDPH
jgi:hypothetical protein